MNKSREIRFHPSIEEDSSEPDLSMTLRKTSPEIRFSIYNSIEHMDLIGEFTKLVVQAVILEQNSW